MRRLLWLFLAVSAILGISLGAYRLGFTQGKMLAEGVLQPSGAVILHADGTCVPYLNGEPVTVQFEHPYRAQFVVAIWELPVSAK